MSDSSENTERPWCAATSKLSNAPCEWRALDGSDYCAKHSNDPALVAARVEQSSQNGRRGQAARRAQARAELREARMKDKAQLDALSFKTPEALRAFIEQQTARVVRGSLPVERANAAAKLAAVAASLLRGDLEKQAAEIAALLEKYPELAKRMEGSSEPQ